LIAFMGTVGLAIVTLTGVVEVWHVVVFALLGGIARAVQTPAQQAMIPALVEKDQLLSGMALSSVSVHGSRLAGPLVGGILLEVWGAGSVFVLSAILYFGGAICLWRMRYRNTAPLGTQRLSVARLFSEMGEGARYIGRDRRVALVITLVVFHCALTMAFDSLIPELAHDLGGGGQLYSALLMGLGAGAITGTVGIAKIPTLAVQGKVLAICGAASGLSMLTLGFAPTPALAIAGAVIAGGSQASYMALSATFVQDMTPDLLRGRVMSLYVMLAAGHMAFVNLGMGALADIVGVRPLLVIPGLLWTVVFIVGVVSLADMRQLLRRGTFGTAAPAMESVPAS
ncbi:MAG: MFS transporter, partial [Dehalococcoidia bacterium]